MKRVLVVFLLLAAGLGGYAWFNATQLAEKLLRDQLAKLQIPVESLTVSLVTTKTIHISDIALGEHGALRAKSATLHFDVDWRTRKLRGALEGTIDGVEAHALVQGGQLLLGGVEKSWGALPVTPDKSAIAVDLRGQLSFTRDAQGHVQLALKEGLLTLMQKQQNMLLPLTVDATAEGNAAAFTAQGTFRDARRNVQGTFTGNYALAKKTGTIRWQTSPMAFSPKGFTFAELSPGFAEGVATLNSKLSLSGVVQLSPQQWTVTPTVTVLELPVDTLLASVFGKEAAIEGKVKGSVPIRIRKGGAWRIEKSRLINIGPMAIRVNPTTSGSALDAHPQAELVKSALSNLQVQTLTLDLQSTDDRGNVRLDWHFLGRNPDILGGKPVDLTLAVTLNLRDMLRSMQEVKRATKEAEKLLLRQR